MILPLSFHVIVTIFVQYLIKTLVRTGPNGKPILNPIAVDIVCLLKSEFDSDKVIVFLNQQYPNLKLTIETEMHNQLLFLNLPFTNNQENLLAFFGLWQKAFQWFLH